MAKKEKEASYNYNKFNQISPAANVVLSIFLILLALITVYPVLLMLSISVTDHNLVGDNPYTLIPVKFTLVAYQAVFDTGQGLLTAYAFTIFRTLFKAVWGLFMMSMYAYVIAQKNFVARGFYTYYMFFTMVFGAGMIPCYIVNTNILHITDTIWIMILPACIGASWIIMLRTFLTSTIPDALFESARIDGASNFTIYFKIVLPLFKPGLATIGLFSVVGTWNEWFTGILYITKNAWMTPLATLLQRIQREIEWLKEMARQGGLGPDYIDKLNSTPSETYRMAMTVISTLPIFFAYPFFQRYFIEGLTIGSVKG